MTSPVENESCGDPEELWHQQHSLPYNNTPVAGCPEPGEPGEFYLRLERWGNKHYVSSTKEKELVEFIKLGNYLFGDDYSAFLKKLSEANRQRQEKYKTTSNLEP